MMAGLRARSMMRVAAMAPSLLLLLMAVAVAPMGVQAQAQTLMAVEHVGLPSEQPARYSNAFDEASLLQKILDIEARACQEACLAMGECKAMFHYRLTSGSTRCHLLSKTGSPAATGLVSTSAVKIPQNQVSLRCNSFNDLNKACVSGCAVGRCFFSTCIVNSNSRPLVDGTTCANGDNDGVCSQAVDWSAAPSLIGYSVTASGSNAENEHLRFSTAFDATKILAKLTGVASFEACTKACDADPDCAGVFAWEHSSDLLGLECRLLSDTGTLIPTSTTSFSLSKAATSRFDLHYIGTGANEATSRRFSTAFDAAHVLSKFNDATAEDCARACVADPACAGFVQVDFGSTLQCRTLDDLGVDGGVPTTTLSLSYALST
ncbi:hypothetical protein PTSG_06048 [Salpingoeca rosetta]|uniref:Apple domain-containing protein n=1 Tax=Salpingoeca rosetta (strain ATCC 50818 / BSB-021) TaxID=946362 RepID=F2UDJ0_SALR5|nr:uncharacterized protein PTSG_06048 [Salpingoeca rosetta]EGD74685.1 hypothetical protein PTSG_06048 [Salpingoeca rosetta]|eukprot:XP_004992942.1 hypothetical protein PTSG_06048 [Salpingoeca rosetta]